MNTSEAIMRGPASCSGETICTVFDGDFHYGLAAFVNSLVQVGYKGTVWAGYRGALPPWVDQLRRVDEAGDVYMVTDHVRLGFLPIGGEIHIANCKPGFMLSLLANQARDCSYIWFFDSDIFMRANWSFFVTWQRFGIALCQDILHHPLPESDPLRQQWVEIGSSMGLGRPRALTQYFNAGLVGIPATAVSFLQLWQRLVEKAGAMGVDLKAFVPGTRELPFFACEQDALNIAAMYTEHPISPTGPEIMGFRPGRPVTYHAVGPKPWRGSMLLRALAAEPPSGAAKFFFSHASSPIRLYSPLRLRAKRLECAAAAFIGRFYRRM